jgi:aromatic-L-amino-acid/L-tryptophan decarboxylase
MPDGPEAGSETCTEAAETGAEDASSWAEPRELELSEPAMRSLVEETMARLLPHLRGLSRGPTHRNNGARKLARSLREPMPLAGSPTQDVFRLLFDRVLPSGLGTATPGYLAYVPGGGIFHAALASFITSATNRYVGIFQASPGLVQLEQNVVRWFCDLVGFPDTAGGVLTTGGSLANLAAIVAARTEKLPPRFQDGVIYTSSEAHRSVQKAAKVAGFLAENVRALPVDESHRLRLDVLAEAIADDRSSGKLPFLIVGNAGTTNTGAIDPLHALADLAARENLWLHLDAAYGGFFLLTARGRSKLAGIERADSVTLDPHKGLFLPYGTGAIVVRDVGTLHRAHHVDAEYLPSPEDDASFVDFASLSPELSRDARGLRVWLPLKLHGSQAFTAALDEKLDLAAEAVRRLEEIPGIEIVAAPELSLFAFRYRFTGEKGPSLDAKNRRLLSLTNQRRRVLISGTLVPSGYVLRVCVLSFRTHRAQIDHLVADLRGALDELLARGW